jgi:arginine-tRNA-protein transferase
MKRLTEQPATRFPQFYLTTPAPCPYLHGRLERKVFTQLSGHAAPALNDALTHAGFRRSQNIAYKPACDGCTECVSVRIRANQLVPTRSHRRVLRRNQDLRPQRLFSVATEEQFDLLRLYLDVRHAGGGMSDMSFEDYRSMVEDSAVSTHIVEYRLAPGEPFDRGRLIAVALTDTLADGLSMVYSFFDPALSDRSLGTYMVLDHVDDAVAQGLEYVYLGYWVRNSQKMAYKARFRPLEALGPYGWAPMRAS